MELNGNQRKSKQIVGNQGNSQEITQNTKRVRCPNCAGARTGARSKRAKDLLTGRWAKVACAHIVFDTLFATCILTD